MASFEVDFSKIRTHSYDIASIYKTINELKQRLDICNNTLRYCMSSSSYAGIRNSLSAASNSLQQQISHLKSLSSGLKQVSNTYSNAENYVKTGKISFAEIMQAVSSTVPFCLTGGSLEDAVVSGVLTGSTSLFGIPASGEISGSFLGYKVEGTNKLKFEVDENGNLKDASYKLGGEASVYGAKGKVEGNYGLLGGSAEASLLNLSAVGSIGASLFEDGKFSPALVAEIKGKANVAEGSAEAKFGNDDLNAHVKASGEVLGAEAEISGKAGKITYKDASGHEVTTYGVQGKVGAEAYLAQGTISGGFDLFGIKVDASLTGKAGGAGVSAGGQITGNGASGSIGAGLGLGGGVDISVDWSGAVKNIQNVTNFVADGWNSIADGVSKMKFW